jgi:hypothetical protein
MSRSRATKRSKSLGDEKPSAKSSRASKNKVCHSFSIHSDAAASVAPPSLDARSSIPKPKFANFWPEIGINKLRGGSCAVPPPPPPPLIRNAAVVCSTEAVLRVQRAGRWPNDGSVRRVRRLVPRRLHRDDQGSFAGPSPAPHHAAYGHKKRTPTWSLALRLSFNLPPLHVLRRNRLPRASSSRSRALAALRRRTALPQRS